MVFTYNSEKQVSHNKLTEAHNSLKPTPVAVRTSPAATKKIRIFLKI
jgi:hypothetical protein